MARRIGPRSASYLAWRVTTVAVWTVALVAAGCVVADVAIWGLTFASPGITMPEGIFVPFFAFALLGNAIAVLSTAASNGVTSIMLRPVRWTIAVPVIVVFFFLAGGPAQLLTGAPGQPGYNAFTHEYYFDDHGSSTPTTRTYYLAAVAAQTRGFIIVAFGVTVIALLFCVDELVRRRKVHTPRLADIPKPLPRPRWCPPVWLSTAVAVGTLAMTAALPFGRIVTRVNAYSGRTPEAVTTSGTTEYLTRGPWVVFTWCETHATDPSFGCPAMSPTDIVVRDRATRTVIPTAPDPSTDNNSFGQLPAQGQLTFEVTRASDYELVLTQRVPKGVFVARSPGSVARSLVGAIVLCVLGLAVGTLGVLLIVRRVGWRLRFAPRVIIEAS